jgi:hypothetical protein
MADKKAQLPGEPLLDYIARIGTGEYVKRLSQEKVANKLKSDERKSGQGYFKKKVKPLKLINKSLMMIFTKRTDTLNIPSDAGPFKKKKIMSVKQGGFALTLNTPVVSLMVRLMI